MFRKICQKNAALNLASLGVLFILIAYKAHNPFFVENLLQELRIITWESWLPQNRHVYFFPPTTWGSLDQKSLLIIYFATMFFFVFSSFRFSKKNLELALVGSVVVLLSLLLGLKNFLIYISFFLINYLILHSKTCETSPRKIRLFFSSTFSSVSVVAIIYLATKFNIHFIGFSMFLLQVPRVMLYLKEYSEKDIPQKLLFREYAVVFLNPASLLPYIVPRAYRHLNETFRNQSEEKIYKGARQALLEGGLALAFGSLVVNVLSNVLTKLIGAPVDPSLTKSFVALENNQAMSLMATLFSGFMHFLSVFFFLLASNHCKIALFRFCGFNIDGHFKFPYIGPTIVESWNRFAIHYRFMLGELFFNPAFWWLKNFSLIARVTMATFYSILFGSVVLTFFSFIGTQKISQFNLQNYLLAFPYFFVLAVGITLSQIIYLKSSLSNVQRHTPLKKILGYSVVVLFISFIHLLASPESGYSGVKILSLIWNSL